MIGRMEFSRVLVVAFVASMVGGASALALDQEGTTPPEIREIEAAVRSLTASHVRPPEIDSALKRRAALVFLEQLDPTHSLWLAAEASALSNEMASLDLADPKLLRLLESSMERADQCFLAYVEYARSQLADPHFAVNADSCVPASFTELQWPESTAARATDWSALIELRVATYIAAGESLPSAKQRLLRALMLQAQRREEVDTQRVIDMYLDSVASAMDPHSSFMSKEDWENFVISLELALEGIGVVVTDNSGFTTVVEVVPRSPAEEAGLLPDDRIIAVASEHGSPPVDVIDWSARDVGGLIRGPRGSEVTLTIMRPDGVGGVFDVRLRRDFVDVSNQAAELEIYRKQFDHRVLNFGILGLDSFYGSDQSPGRSCSRDIIGILSSEEAQKLDGLVLDLSRNRGGRLEEAVAVAGLFLDSGVIVQVIGRGEEAGVYSDSDGSALFSGPLVVLTSRITASAAEILAGALRDHRRAVIVGDGRTFGKGTVQKVTPVESGLGAEVVTTSAFYQPSGQSPQIQGVPSDVVLPSIYAQEDFGEVARNGALHLQPVRSAIVGDAEATKTTWRVPKGGLDWLQELANDRVSEDPRSLALRAELTRAAARSDQLCVKELLNNGIAQTPSMLRSEIADMNHNFLREHALLVVTDLVVRGDAY